MEKTALKRVVFIKSLPRPVGERGVVSRFQTDNPCERASLVPELWQLANGWIECCGQRYAPHLVDYAVLADAAPATAQTPNRAADGNASDVAGNPPVETSDQGTAAVASAAPVGGLLKAKRGPGRPPKEQQ